MLEPVIRRLLCLSLLPGCAWLQAAPEPPPDRLRCDRVKDLTCYIQVPGGTLLRGAQSSDPAAPGYDPEAASDEGPVREVAVSSFWMLRHELTVNDARRCSACEGLDAARGDPLMNLYASGRNEHPINGLSWHDARRMCESIGGRLPTEVEWEYAARGGDGRRFPWGNTPGCGSTRAGDKLWSVHEMAEPPCIHEGTFTFSELRGDSPFGMVGMAGNVAEWVEDVYTATYDVPSQGDDLRGIRGGSWLDQDAAALRSSARGALPPDVRLPDVGARCVWAGTPVQAPAAVSAGPGKHEPK